MSQSSCERAAALSNAALLIRQRAHAFSAEHATERAVVSYLAAHNISLTTIVDVGAGAYTYNRGSLADASGVEATFRQLGSTVHYFGFEPNINDHRALLRIVSRSRVIPHGRVHLFPLALAGTPGLKPFFAEPTWTRNRNGSGVHGPRWLPRWSMASSPNTHTTNAALEGLGAYRRVGHVNATTLDLIASASPLLCCNRTIDFVKVDTEGTEADVLLTGAQSLLQAQRIRSILWEYGDKISADAFRAAKDKAFVPPPTPDAMVGPNLKRNVAALERHGYQSYFAGVLRSGSAVFVPLNGGYWDDAMELCRAPPSSVCWHDILSTVANSAEDRAIRASPSPATWRHRVAICPGV